MTRFEVALGAAMAALVLAGGLFVTRNVSAEGDRESAERRARTIQSAAEAWRAETGDTACPTLSALLHEGHLADTARLDDPWGNRFKVKCDGDETVVHSAGADRKRNTADDLHVDS